MKTKLLSATLAVSILSSCCTVFVAAADEKEKVRILVENNTFSVSDGAAWDGVLIDEWVEISSDKSAADILNDTLSAHGYTQTGANDNWITDINGLSYAADEAKMGGWMVGIDDWYGNGGITTLSLEDGDELMLSYSLTWGSDIGYDYTSTSTKLSSLKTDKGILEPEFSPEITEYTLKLDSDEDSINIFPTAENKGFRYKIYKNDYSPDTDNTDIKRTTSIEVSNGDVIYVGVGHKEWHSFYTDGASETVYKLTINEKTDDSENKDPSGQGEKENPVEKNTVDFETMFKETSDTILKSPTLTEVGSEWQILGLARSSQLSENDSNTYLKNLSLFLSEKTLNKATDCSKYALVKKALGEDASALTSPLSDYDFCIKQGVNGAIYSLLAIDANNSGSEKTDNVELEKSRQALIDYIISQQQENGGWAFFGDAYEPDMTGMALQALAPYYKKDEKVTEAVDMALELLSSTMNDDGTFTSYGAPNSESSAQVIIALTSLGIDLKTDERFIKENGNLISGLSLFYKNEKGMFSHGINEDENALSTLQSFSALCAYYRFLNGKTSFYDMTDVKAAVSESDPSSEPQSEPEKPDNKDNDLSSSEKTNPNGIKTFPTGDNTAIALIILMLSAGASISVIKYTKKKVRK